MRRCTRSTGTVWETKPFEQKSARAVQFFVKTIPVRSAILCATALLLVSGCVVRERRYGHRPGVVRETVVVGPVVGTEVIVTQAPPPPRTEVIVVRPGPAYVWVPGAWVWQGRWVWEGGHWAQPPRPNGVWVAPHYVYRGGTHVYVHGGWRF